MNKVLNAFCMLLISISGFAQETEYPAEDYVKITDDGAWCWFSDPRVLYANDMYFGGYVNSEGDIESFSYNPKTNETKHVTHMEKLDQDDHANPSITTLEDGRLITFFTAHGDKKPMYYRISKNKYDVTEWEPVQEISNYGNGSFGATYSNPVSLSEESNRLFLFFRGTDFKPNFMYSDDLENWSEAKTLIKNAEDSREGPRGRPYLKVANNGKDQIHFAFTNGHPRQKYLNSIYYMSYKDGALRKANGDKIGTLADAPYTHEQADLVYDAGKSKHRAWVWDVAYDANDYPVIAYVQFVSELKHQYWYARWDGEKWQNHKITDAGRWFQRNYDPKENEEDEPHYSGGLYLDHNNPDVVYLSKPVNDVFEIQKWTTKNYGNNWEIDSITQNSSKDNVRPYVALNDPNSKVFWMYNHDYAGFTNYHSAIRVNDVSKGFSASFKKEDVKHVMKEVADWQIEDFPEATKGNVSMYWVNATLFYGMSQWAKMADSESYYDWLHTIGKKNYWQVGERMYHADDICIGQTYLELYKKYKKDDILIPTIARTEWVIENTPKWDKNNTEDNFRRNHKRWSWCDALFMGPPVYAGLYEATGDKKYLKYMDDGFKITYDFLYDEDESLFYRDLRFPSMKEANGEKVFWGRGNGWVIGGLVNILKAVPKGNKYRPYYENLYKDMCKRVVGLQDEEGFWHASLLDPESYPVPETSATGFMVYGIAYGINNGLLEGQEYKEAAKKGWSALVSAVNTEGKLGWVQPVGASPKSVTKNMTQKYGVGAFLMAGSEVYLMSTPEDMLSR
ncbi:glycoside hydrolase family 88 protein [Joostella atrarenae]|uniref:Glycoside hydrolase family 88 protein n=1 Tax=Joostella atrarenae TaxID=679257 RepID=A0ABS9IZP7_9FLAO|nr:glycoside hydrolase family 88 protein [Joostella atrarenae]MCF8713644.1 glycoside hydrolase family 88 protein [Joostella atrarenae]